MATATTGFLLVNKHFQVEAFQNKKIYQMKKAVKDEMRMASASSRRKTISQEYGVWKKHFGRVNAATGEERQKLNSWKSNISGGSGSLVQDGLVYRQNFLVRSFEIGFDRKLSLAALTNYLQDTALEQCRVIGISADGFGSTPEMSRQDLIWVTSTLQIVVDSYPSWHDCVEVDTWFYPSGQNSVGRDWIVRDGKTGCTLAQATSVWVLMNKKTRKLSKLKEEIRDELAPHMRNCDPIIVKDRRKLLRLDVDTADFAREGVKPDWDQLDLNQHVNHVQYINWILEIVPRSFVEHHKLSSITLEYRKECTTDSVLQSLAKIVKNGVRHNSNDKVIELEHLLLLENGSEIARGSTSWKPRDIPA
ncbi:palmitoyl-acyl carrier protein thioesterase, chloroplastic [Manihot esculenta]|uniref:Acyl-[acyl-carrier-protein] hydrolase n=1 Tax=Manihot esculenta TaxID=3983 RepID=A0A2C9UYM0_MANES|nr:palmitoyl-acyl carrier protein thioesterase, chloroplastic [Manihot esculenta]OAY36826.1 hypothetical protein MANES_11G051800v8 [Manihot esculenta]